MPFTLLAACFVLAALAEAVAEETPPAPSVIRRVDLVHMTHTDVGFTDHPLVGQDRQRGPGPQEKPDHCEKASFAARRTGRV